MSTAIPDTIEELTHGSAQVSPGQYDYLCKGIDPSRVRQLQGQSHIEAWDVRRTLIRVFGFGGFDIESRYETLVREIESPPGTIKRIDFKTKKETTNEKTVWTVVYRVGLRLIVKDIHGREITHVDDSATGDSVNQPSLGDAHDMSLKTAHSQALKRCAVNLGDQFGLSLYNKGGTGGVVVRSLVSPTTGQSAPTPEDAPPVLGGEMDETHDEAPAAETPEPVVPAQPARGQRPQPTPEAKPGPAPERPSPQKHAQIVADLARQITDADQLLRTYDEAKARELLDAPVTVHAALLGQVGIKPAPTVALGVWLTAAGKFVRANGGMSIADAARAAAAPVGA